MKEKPLVNIHCHALYGVDDGARNLEESVTLFEMAREEGVCEEILTSHHISGMGRKHLLREIDNFKRLEEYVNENIPDFRIHLGNEIYYSYNSVRELKLKNIFTLADSRYILVEFNYGISFDVILSAVKEFLSAGYVPILAHIERYGALYGNDERVVRLIENGAFIQVNSRSFMGSLFDKRTRWLVSMLNGGCIHFIGDDHHRPQGRPPLMKSCYERLAKKCDEDILDRVFTENPRKVIENRLL